MRHQASLLVALEGMSRAAFSTARELCQNSRSGLTTRFLAKKLDMPEEEIEYLIDVNHRLFFTDLTKIKVVPEGASAVKRIAEGLENHGDVPSLFRRVKSLSPHEFRRLEEQIGIEKPGGKKAGAEALLERHFRHPESVIEYVASGEFSSTAREVFDILWQSKTGVMPVSQLRIAHGGNEFEVEQGLSELFDGFAVFEMFRFDAEERLVRVAGLLSEVRQWREENEGGSTQQTKLKPFRGKPQNMESRGLSFSDLVCRLVAAIAAKPARLRGDGDLFREDQRRLSEIQGEDADPSLSACLWVGQGTGWIARVDDELRAADLQELIQLDRVGRHKQLYDWLVSTGNEVRSLRILKRHADEMKPEAWYSSMDFVEHAMEANAELDQPVLKNTGGTWRYISPSASGSSERTLARSLEETLLWLGVVDRAQTADGDGLFRLSELGRCLLADEGYAEISKEYPPRDTEIVVQPNFDIVVPTHEIDPLLTVPLDQFADRLSTGQATVYQLSKDSYTRGIQDGHDGEAFVAFLLRHNRGGSLPRNVMSTLEDWRGGMKRVRLRTIHVLESDDALVIADLQHRKRLKKHLAALDPRRMVSYAKISKAELTKALEKDGFVVE